MTTPESGRRHAYAGFWTRAAARLIDIIIILAIYNLFYLADRLGADAGLWSAPGLAEGDVENTFSAGNFLRGVFILGFPVFYFVFLHGAYGQTFGKMALKIRLVGEDESPVGYRTAAKRWLVEFVFNMILPFLILFVLAVAASIVEFVLNKASSLISVLESLRSAFNWVVGLAAVVIMMLPTGIMFLWAAFDRRKQGLHDKVCRTLVVKVEGTGRADTAQPSPPANPPAGPGVPPRTDPASAAAG